jgi:hypothetical protein
MGWKIRTTEEVTVDDRRLGTITLPPGVWDMHPASARPLIDAGKAERLTPDDPEIKGAEPVRPIPQDVEVNP